MARRCSHCSRDGHNSRTCPHGLKLFGVRITTDGPPMRKSASTGNLMHYPGGSPAGAVEAAEKEAGYASEGFVKGRDRKKGIAWTEEEHKKFLFGLRKLGKGDWRGISRDYVGSRTSTQVASHAQKYFIRQSNANKRKKRSSLFDIKPDECGDDDSLPMGSQEPEAECSNPLPAPPPRGAECESMVSNSKGKEVAVSLPRPETIQYPYPMIPRPETIQYPYPMIPRPETIQYPYPMMAPAFYPNYFPIPLPFFMGYRADTTENKSHEVFKPTALRLKVNADKLAGMSILSLRESTGEISSLSTTPNLLGDSEGHSAFHANTRPSTGSSMNSGSSPIHAI